MSQRDQRALCGNGPDGLVDLFEQVAVVGRQGCECLLRIPQIWISDEAQVVFVGSYSNKRQPGALNQVRVVSVRNERHLSAERVECARDTQ